jgi:hypothetical protein
MKMRQFPVFVYPEEAEPNPYRAAGVARNETD